jgi:hypothetical protein
VYAKVIIINKRHESLYLQQIDEKRKGWRRKKHTRFFKMVGCRYEYEDIALFFLEESRRDVYFVDRLERTFAFASDFKTTLSFAEAARIIRWVIAKGLIEDGWDVIHGAAIKSRSLGMCFVGEKFSGKTTATFKMAFEGSDLISNDKIFIRIVGAEIRILSWPMEVCLVGLGCAKHFERMRLLYRNSNSLKLKPYFFPNPEYLKFSSTKLWYWPGKISITRKELSDILGISLASEFHLNAILFPFARPYIAYSTISVLAKHDVSERVTRALYDPTDKEVPWPTSRKHNSDLPRQIANAIDGYELSFGENLDEIPLLLSKILEIDKESNERYSY